MNETGRQHIKHLDGLRGIAILLVLARHFTTGTFLEKYFILGWTGVDLFFVLSGFLITRILLDIKQEKGYYRIFIVRRMLRIFPLYYTVLIVCLFLSFHLSMLGWFRNYQVYFWTYTQNILVAQKGFFTVPLGHFWTLAIEEQFYLFWPLAVLSLKPRHLLAAIAVLITVAIAIRWYHPAALPLVTVFTAARWDGLLAGAAIAILMKSDKDGLLKKAPALLFIFSLILILLLVSQQPWSRFSVTFKSAGYTIIVFFYGSLLLFSFRDNRIKKALSSNILIWFGKYSYAIYVFHPIIINSGTYYYPDLVNNHKAIAYGIMLLLSLGLSYASYHLLEKHFLKMKPSLSK